MKLVKDHPAQKDLKHTQAGDEGTFFTNVEYKGFNLETPFILKAESAYQTNREEDDPNVVFMDGMHLIIYLENRQIDIFSDTGSYNKITNDVFMQNSVKVVESPGTIKIFADNLNLLAASSEAEIFNNVNLVNGEGSFLQANSVKYDLLDKKLKISAEDDKLIKMKVIK